MFLDKLDGLSTTVTFLAILTDTARLELREPLDKLARLRCVAASSSGRRSGGRSDLESLHGHFCYAAVVVKPRRIFLWQLFSLMARASERHYFVQLELIATVNLACWDCFLQSWHGTSFMIPDNALYIQVHVNASGTFGCGALTSANKWLQVQWPASWHDVNILVKEMVPVVMSAAMWRGGEE